jgi:hypothetical protein
MPDKYAADGIITNVTASPGDSTLGLTQPTTTPLGKRLTIYDILFSQGGTPADNVIEWIIRRGTTIGTGTTVTPQALDPGAPAAEFTGRETYTAEPTLSGDLLHFDLNQRSSWRWVALIENGFILPNTADNGIVATPISSYTGTARTTMHYVE